MVPWSCFLSEQTHDLLSTLQSRCVVQVCRQRACHTHQGGHSEHLHGEVSDRELPVVVVFHIVALQALIILPVAGGEEGGDKRRREVCVWEVYTGGGGGGESPRVGG